MFQNEDEGLRVIVKLGSRSKVYLKSQIRDLDLELDSIIAIVTHHHHHHNPPIKLF